MEWLQSLFDGESGTAVQLILMVLGLAIILMLVVWIFRRIAGTPARKAARNRVPRLSITDVTAVDDKRFLVLARRDNVEHLILIGGNGDVVVETGIVRTQAAQQPAQMEAPAPKPAANAVEQEAPQAEAKPEAGVSLKPELGTATAAVAATGAAIGGAVSATSEAVADTASSAASKMDAAADATASTIEDTIAALKPDDEAPSVETSPEPEISVDAGSADAIDAEVSLEEPALELDNLEAELSETLDSALSVDDLEVTAEAEVKSTDDGKGSKSGEDEMQKLLDELSRETKAPAQ